MDKVEIIIPVFNQLKYTEACLNSLYRNTDHSKFHLIVVDNNSEKETRDFLKQYKAKSPNMDLVLNDENLGWCKAINLSYKYLHRDSTYVCWCNNDILFEQDWMEKMLNHFKGNVGAVGPTSNYVMGRQYVVFNHGQQEEYQKFLVGFCLMFRREVIDLVGDVDERFGIGGSEEMDYILRMSTQLGLGCLIARDVYIHHFGSKTLMPYVGNTPDGYNDLIKEKDSILRQKWGDKIVDDLFTPPQRQILVGVPHNGYIHHKFWADSIMLLRPDGTEFMEVVRTSAIHDARNVICEFAIKENFKYLLFIDSDMRIPQNAIFKLLSYKKPIVAGYFFSRSGNYYPCAFEYDQKEDGYLPIFKPNSGLIEVDAVGMACTLIDVNILKEINNPWFYWGKFGEDMHFCKQVREKGYKIFVDTDLVIKHISEERREIGPEDYIQNEVKS